MKKNMFRFIFVFIFSICVYTLNICDIFAGTYIFGNEAITNTFSQRVCFYKKIYDRKIYNDKISGKIENDGKSLEEDLEDGNVNPDNATYYAVKFDWKNSSDDSNSSIKDYRVYKGYKTDEYHHEEYFARLWPKKEVPTNDILRVSRDKLYHECPSALYFGGESWMFHIEDINAADPLYAIEVKNKLLVSVSCRYSLKDLIGSNEEIVFHALEDGKFFPETGAAQEIEHNLSFSNFKGKNGGLICPESLSGKLDGDKIKISVPTNGTSGNLKMDNAVSNTDDDSSFNSSSVAVGCKNGEGTEIGRFEMKKSNIPGSNVSNIKIETAGYLRDTCSITVTGGNKFTEKIGGPWCKTDNYYLTNTQLSNGNVSFKVYSCGSNIEETEVKLPTGTCEYYSSNYKNIKVEITGSFSDKKILSANIIGQCSPVEFINVSYDEIFDGMDCKENANLTINLEKCHVISDRNIHRTGKRICGIFKENGKLIGVFKNLYAILRISIPVLILCLTIVEFLKVLFSGEGKTMKEAFKATVSRFILLAVVVLLPFIISFITRLAGIYDTCYKFFI